MQLKAIAKPFLALLLAIYPAGCSLPVSGTADGSAMDQQVAPDHSALQDLAPAPDEAANHHYTCGDNDTCDQPFCEQVLIEAGELLMGDDNEPDPSKSSFGAGDPRPRHRVYLDAYCIDQYQVSIGRYLACIEAGQCDNLPVIPLGHHCPTEAEQAPDDYPVLGTSYDHASTYCQWIGRRLCTEAEWERAASGPAPGKRTYPWGEDPPVHNVHGSFLSGIENVCSRLDAHPQGRSLEGAYDLAGNGYEWVSDWYAPYDPPKDDSPRYNPTGPETGAAKDQGLVRGGCPFVVSTYTSFERTVIDRSFDGG